VSATCWIGLDAGHEDLDETEHAASVLADTLGLADEVCTHGTWAPGRPDELRALAEGALVFEGRDRAVEIGGAAGRSGARAAIAAHAAATGGRAVTFAGQEMLVGALSVEEILATSAIDEVRPLGADLVPGALIETRGYLRPQYMAGLLTLVVTPAEGGRLQPFELEHVHQCCGGH